MAEPLKTYQEIARDFGAFADLSESQENELAGRLREWAEAIVRECENPSTNPYVASRVRRDLGLDR